jgi:hypothetical protein
VLHWYAAETRSGFPPFKITAVIDQVGVEKAFSFVQQVVAEEKFRPVLTVEVVACSVVVYIAGQFEQRSSMPTRRRCVYQPRQVVIEVAEGAVEFLLPFRWAPNRVEQDKDFCCLLLSLADQDRACPLVLARQLLLGARQLLGACQQNRETFSDQPQPLCAGLRAKCHNLFVNFDLLVAQSSPPSSARYS